MLLDEYQKASMETAVYLKQNSIGGLVYSTLGLAGESGELANKVKKLLRDDGGEVTPERREQMEDELGDVLWYVASVARELKSDLSAVARRNLDKLKSRKERMQLHGNGDVR